MAAVSKAKAAAENLDLDGADDIQISTGRTPGPEAENWQDEAPSDDSGSHLR
jgi:hypothetical protein